MREFLSGVAILVLVILSRWLSLYCTSELSADESELLVQVSRYDHDPVPWRSVDGSTIGPANPWFLILARCTHWPMNYQGLHLLSAVLLGAIAMVSYFTLRLAVPFAPAGLTALAGVIALSCTSSVNFMYFATELVPSLTLATAVFTLLWARQKRPGWLLILAVGVSLAGCAPWAKLQAGPLSLLLVVYAGTIAWSNYAAPHPAKSIKAIALIAICALIPSIFILAVVTSGGAFPDFVASYVVANLGYAGSFTVNDASMRLLRLWQRSELNGLIAAIGVLALLCGGRKWLGPKLQMDNRPTGKFLLFSLLYLATAFFVCIRPPYEFEHYHIFLIGPLLLMLGALIQRLQLPDSPSLISPLWSRWKVAAIACTLIPVTGFSLLHYEAGSPLRTHLAELQNGPDERLPARVAEAIRRLSPKASTMVVWGWMPTLYIKTGLHSATRQTISHFLIDGGPSRNFIRQQFMADVIASHPDIIVDAVASDCFTWNWNINEARLESFPEFADYVKKNYVPALTVVTDPTGLPLRVFRRKSAD